MKHIFVSIASYRDPECQHTVHDLFTKARHPERVSVGICWQVDPVLDADCFTLPYPFPRQVREKRYRVEESQGGCWARAEALSLHEDEDYILQIDAHMRFVPHWDEELLGVVARCPSKDAVFSTMPPNYTPPDTLQDCSDGIPIAHADALGGPDEMQPLHVKGHWRPLSQTSNQPVLGAFFVGNFLFAPAEAIRKVPFDPHIFFRGQELVYAARLWTHGYDIYNPDRVIVFHHWNSVSRPALGGKAHYKEENSTSSLAARKRVRHLLAMETSTDAQVLRDSDAYGMGKVRSLEDYWRFSGVDLVRGTLAERALHAAWKPYIPVGSQQVAFSLGGTCSMTQPVWNSAVTFDIK